MKAATGSAGPLSPSRTLTHVHSAPSATVKQEKPDTARRASDDSATSGQINRSMLLSKAEESQLSPSRTGSEPPAPLGLRQGPSWAARAPSVHFSPMSDGPTRPGSVGPDSCRAPRAQRSRSSTLPAPQILTDGSAPSVFDPKPRIFNGTGGTVLAAPLMFFAVVPLVVCRGRRVVFLRGAVYDGGEGPPFPGPPRREAHCVFARPERAQAHWSRRA